MDRWLIALLVLAGALRLGWVLHLPADPSTLTQLPDQLEYRELGQNLAAGEGLGFIDPRFGSAIFAYRMPGYPLLVALCRADLRIIRIVQALLDVSSVLAVYLLARRWLDDWPARVAAALIALNPFLIYFCGLILSETLFSCMLIWGMTLLVIGRRSLAWIGGISLLILSIYVRPSAMALPMVLAIAGAFVNRDRRRPYDWRWSPPVGTLTLALTILALLPWAIRNRYVLNAWIWTTTNSGITLYDGLNPNATGASDQRFVSSMPQLKMMDEVGRSHYLSDLAMQFVRQEPLRTLQLAVIKLGRTWSPIPLSAEYGTDPRLVAIAAAYMVPLYLAILVGLWLGPAPRAAKVLLAAPAVYFTIAHAISVGSLRYRIPADLPLAVLAGLALQHWINRRRRQTDSISDDKAERPIEIAESGTLTPEP